MSDLKIPTLRRSEPYREVPDEDMPFCDGDVEHDGSKYWLCKVCGRIGAAHHQPHYPPKKLLVTPPAPDPKKTARQNRLNLRLFYAYYAFLFMNE